MQGELVVGGSEVYGHFREQRQTVGVQMRLPPYLGRQQPINPQPGIYKTPGRRFPRGNAGPTWKEWPRGGSAGAVDSVTGGQIAAFIQLAR